MSATVVVPLLVALAPSLVAWAVLVTEAIFTAPPARAMLLTVLLATALASLSVSVLTLFERMVP